MKKQILILGTISLLLLAACSNGEEKVDKEEPEQEVEQIENVDKEEELDEQEYYNSLDSKQEHQKDLPFGQTGTVISGSIGKMHHAEITPLSVEYLDEFENKERDYTYTAQEETIIKVSVKVKNIDVKRLAMRNVIRTFFGPVADNPDETVLSGSVYEEIHYKDKIFSDEYVIEPGEEFIVDYYFDINKGNEYKLTNGSSYDQVITYAQWKVFEENFE